ncbi:condensation domain-containing protein [Rothia sp. AR01]|uniref:Condensation domain-containing protein n=1 Tax=Rothia santali TaxID=2949643 RepID=A0A9X2KHD8_9MICC|nr:condensation domain-containing protein [Rothia santali]MCP3424659.1 condensation domain-containing protein [Rothia santali]
MRGRAAAHGLTPSAVALAAYAEVVARWSRHGDLTLNLPVSRRLPLHPDVPRVVGDFTSLSLLAVRADDGASFAERARARQGRLLEDLDHGLYSGNEVLAELSRRRGEAAVLMPVVFTGALGADDADAAPDRSWSLREVHGLSQTPQVWLDCQVSLDADGLALRWDVREGVLVGGVAAEAFAAYERLLRALATSDAPWEADDVVPLPAGQAAVRERVNATAAPLAEGLLHEAAARGHRGPGRHGRGAPRGRADPRRAVGPGRRRRGGPAGGRRAARERVGIVMDKGPSRSWPRWPPRSREPCTCPWTRPSPRPAAPASSRTPASARC